MIAQIQSCTSLQNLSYGISVQDYSWDDEANLNSELHTFRDVSALRGLHCHTLSFFADFSADYFTQTHSSSEMLRHVPWLDIAANIALWPDLSTVRVMVRQCTASLDSVKRSEEHKQQILQALDALQHNYGMTVTNTACCLLISCFSQGY